MSAQSSKPALLIHMDQCRAATDRLCAALGLAVGALAFVPPHYLCRMPAADVLQLAVARGVDLETYYDSPIARNALALDDSAPRQLRLGI